MVLKLPKWESMVGGIVDSEWKQAVSAHPSGGMCSSRESGDQRGCLAFSVSE